MALKKQCDRCGTQTDASGNDDDYNVRGRSGNRWGTMTASTVGDDYGDKLIGKDLCGKCWKLLREDFMNGNGIPALDRTKL